MTIVELTSIPADAIDLVGGKAVGLAEVHKTGLAVPAGFCLTTEAYRAVVTTPENILATPLSDQLRGEITDAYERICGGRSVAVRSSATAEDLPYASFAGQQDTYLNVSGAEEVIAAVRRCWASLWSERAVSYREASGVPHEEIAIAVVVQVMVDAEVAGVLFTANPVTGTRTEMVVDAAPGLGEAVVSGTIVPDRYVLGPPQEHGCLSTERQRELVAAGRRLEEHFGAPQDVEWAFDAKGTLWVLQSRPITTLFPLPATDRPGTRVYLSASHVQGVLRPMTPMGMSVMRMTAAAMMPGADPLDGPPGFVEIGGRMYADMTVMVRNKRARKNLPQGMSLSEPRAGAAVERLLDDPRFSPEGGMPFKIRSLLRGMAPYILPSVAGLSRTVVRPGSVADRAALLAGRLERETTAPAGMTLAERLNFVEQTPRTIMGGPMAGIVCLLLPGMSYAGAGPGIVGKRAAPGEVDMVMRGMPHNVTTQMDLALWRLAQDLADERDPLLGTPPGELAERFRRGALPVRVAEGLTGFLRMYGRRAVAEIDVGVPRWAEDPAPVFAMLANYLRVTDPDQAPDRRFARAAAEAEAKLAELAGRLGPVRGRLARFALRRARAICGIRELPKFATLHGFGQIREQLLLIGAELVARGLLEVPDDVMFLDIRELRSAVQGADLRQRVGERRAVHERELRRKHVPVVLLSDGTDVDAALPVAPTADGALVATPAAPGVATGPARVILEPGGAQLEPGEVLVAPSTDPGWTPLFLTAVALVTETGGPAGHGPTVAREYGIPAVVGLRAATTEIETGQIITVDGAAGTVTRSG